MKKKWLNVVLAVMLPVMLTAGCGSTNAVTEQLTPAAISTEDNYEVALVMDVGTLNDKSFNQGTWEGLQSYCDENDLTYKYYKAEGDGTEYFQGAIESAIDSGATTVVCPGYLFETPIYNVQDQYPDVKFILIDGEPHNDDYSDYKTATNTMAVLYQEDQAGFLAGYAAVKDGNTNLGFMGGTALPAVIRYGYGYLAGADYAAREMGTNVTVNYTYTGSFEATDEAQAMCSQWYADGTSLIFGCGGSVGNSVMMAAEATDNGKVIGVDVDQSYESSTVVTSAMKMLSNSVYDALTSVYNGSFPGGQTTVFNIQNDGVGIAMDTARFDSFSESEYQSIYDQLISGTIVIDNDVDKTLGDLVFTNLQVNEVVFN